MIIRGAARTGVIAARSVARLASSAGSHVAWWLDYNLGGRARQDRRKPPPQRKR
jgi:membrane protein YqaA with SNARE-associated domain